MNEKIIIKGEYKKAFSTICFLLAIALIVISFILYGMIGGDNSLLECLFFPQSAEGIAVCFWLGIICIVLGIFFKVMNNCEIVVTDKRVYGKAILGKRVDLPLDFVSAVGTSFGGGVEVSTSSGVIKFKGIDNAVSIHKEISDLLMNRQDNSIQPTIKQEIAQSSADELKKYKDLLDSGIISQEEFDAKKKQLLGL